MLMVNLEELLESEKKPYVCPTMVVKRIDFADVIVTSGTMEGGNNDAGGTTLDGNEGVGNDFETGYTIPE